ncbi:tetratricopeptide repeat protein [Pseudoxanthomonas sp. LjRoot125]|uniref:tetratricopeptide repeat protein n=1 Tax=Pseudoxanthomonas sp. LjRoot125 TaxID=3342258 RepID=UPI003E11CE5B
MYDPILEALRRGATADALTAAETLVAERPADAQALRWLSAAQLQNGQADAALASIDRAIALSPENAELHLARAGVLVGSRRPDEAQAALDQATVLDPNQFGAYLSQAQLALARGDLDEAERVNRLAERVAPNHPQLAVVEGMVALQRGEADTALKRVSQAIEAAPDDAQLRYVLGFIYMAKGHLAFAEQAFRAIVEKNPAASSLWGLIADLLGRQGRFDEAADALGTLFADPARATPGLKRLAGHLRLRADQLEQAQPLLEDAVGQGAHDRATLSALLQLWHAQGQQERGRALLEACLALHPRTADLWLARLALEDVGSEAALAVAARWVHVAPESVPALEAQMAALAHAGRGEDADAIAYRILDFVPGHSDAQARKVNALVARDPAAAVAHVESLLQQAQQDEIRQTLLGWLALAQDRAGLRAEAVRSWLKRAEGYLPNSLPPNPLSASSQAWPERGSITPETPSRPLLLWGAPGSGVERMAAVFFASGAPLRSDRFSERAPGDGFQRYVTVQELVNGVKKGDGLIADWRAGLPSRGVHDGNVVDWLVWWDNALLHGLRPRLPEGRLLVALRDPRDMLLEWLAYGSPAMFAISSIEAAADWLATVLDHVATILEQDLYPATVVRLDGIERSPSSIAEALSQALGGTRLAVPPEAGNEGFAAGHWRQYTDALAVPFAVLTPVAVRLGYPAA